MRKLKFTQARKDAIKYHRQLWRWLAKNPKANKSEWPGWKINGGEQKGRRADCFLCEASSGGDPLLNASCVSRCILKWPKRSFRTICGELYTEWNSAAYKNKRSRLAFEISRLPINKERLRDA